MPLTDSLTWSLRDFNPEAITRRIALSAHRIGLGANVAVGLRRRSHRARISLRLRNIAIAMALTRRDAFVDAVASSTQSIEIEIHSFGAAGLRQRNMQSSPSKLFVDVT